MESSLLNCIPGGPLPGPGYMTINNSGLANQNTSPFLNEFIGSCSAMQQLYHLIRQVAYCNSTVLILGETGTGKELAARAVHQHSPRNGKPMVKVNCAALPANLVESELFGHERGSFTGATDRRIGKFELAHNSTLFLDEIGEMPPDLQVKLLRAIQEREIERVGGRSTIKVDVRIIAATNRDLQKEVREGRFRSDLYYRLHVFPILIPPLKERPEDIPLLAGHFVKKYASLTGKKINHIAAYAGKRLMNYSWPGNVRELEHVIERSILLTADNDTVLRDIAIPDANDCSGSHATARADEPVKTIFEMERDHILTTIKKCAGKISGKGGAAALLGVPASTLNSKLTKLGIAKHAKFS